jgi:hypothetical protein
MWNAWERCALAVIVSGSTWRGAWERRGQWAGSTAERSPAKQPTQTTAKIFGIQAGIRPRRDRLAWVPCTNHCAVFLWKYAGMHTVTSAGVF